MMNPSEILCAFVFYLALCCGAALGVLATLAAGVLLFRLARGFVSALRRRLSRPAAAVLALLCLYAVWCGGEKRGGTPPGLEPPREIPGQTEPLTVTPEDVANGWRLESVTTNGAVSYAMPSNGVEYAPHWNGRRSCRASRASGRWTRTQRR